MAQATANPEPHKKEEAEEEEDDYMSMTISEPRKPKEKETYTQRRLRKEREAELKQPRSKAELLALAAATRETALSQPLQSADPGSKGLAMMRAMGYRAGEGLGKATDARTEPVRVQVKEDRGGVGLDAERKRKMREEVGVAYQVEADAAKRRKEDEEGGFRERVGREREERRVEGQVVGAMKVAEGLDGHGDGEDKAGVQRSLKGVHVLWRGLVRRREEKERDRRRRYDLLQSLSRLPTYEDPDEEGDRDLRRALGRDERLGGSSSSSLRVEEVLEEEEEEEEDPELEEFEALEPAERLGRLLGFLREKHHYCFWCKYQYPDEGMDGCPGVTEEDHD
ncbi:MAG: hypothetical protein M1816_002084 [Peltula sp. TS41687]|nr:MAG: hypothetical protein M1816_002084 [Peltula sp. TS41687]